MRTLIRRTTRLLGGLALLAGTLLAMSAPARAQTITATPHNVIVAKDAAQGATTITWDAGAGIKSLGATLWQQIDGGKETLIAAKAKGSQSILIGAGETRVFTLHNVIKSKVLASVTVTATEPGAAPDENAPNAGDALAADGAPANAAGDASTVSFTGTWPTIAGGTHKYTVVLKQIGNQVTGSFSPGNGKIFDGIVVARKLTFNWSQNGGFEGTGEFTLDEDGKGFKGSSTALKPQQFSNTWNSFVPEPASFAGTWETTSNSAPFTLTLQQVGNTVIGTYTPANGTIEGTITGQTLRFKWISDGGKGTGRFVIDEDEMAFRGSYSNGEDPDTADVTWNGTRKLGGGGGKTVVSFAGVWDIKPGGPAAGAAGAFDMTLSQTGARVTGSFFIARGKIRGQIEGDVIGNILVYRMVVGSQRINGQFVMDQGGKSFTGTLNREGTNDNKPLTGIKRSVN